MDTPMWRVQWSWLSSIESLIYQGLEDSFPNALLVNISNGILLVFNFSYVNAKGTVV